MWPAEKTHLSAAFEEASKWDSTAVGQRVPQRTQLLNWDNACVCKTLTQICLTFEVGGAGERENDDLRLFSVGAEKHLAHCESIT